MPARRRGSRASRPPHASAGADRQAFVDLGLRHLAAAVGAAVAYLFWLTRAHWDADTRLWKAVGDASLVLLYATLASGALARMRWPGGLQLDPLAVRWLGPPIAMGAVPGAVWAAREARRRDRPRARALHPPNGALVGLLLVPVVQWALRQAATAPGLVFWQFVLWYSVLRSVIEESFADNPHPLRRAPERAAAKSSTTLVADPVGPEGRLSIDPPQVGRHTLDPEEADR